jgi:hypothetical protein
MHAYWIVKGNPIIGAYLIPCNLFVMEWYAVHVELRVPLNKSLWARAHCTDARMVALHIVLSSEAAVCSFLVPTSKFHAN